MDAINNNWPVASMVAALGLAYAPHFFRGAVVVKSVGTWNNVSPRGQVEKLEGKMTQADHRLALRAGGAHQNGLETLPIYYAAVLVALHAGVPKEVISKYCTSFITARFLYNIIYLTNTSRPAALARTGVWSASIYVCIKLMLLAAQQK